MGQGSHTLSKVGSELWARLWPQEEEVTQPPRGDQRALPTPVSAPLLGGVLALGPCEAQPVSCSMLVTDGEGLPSPGAWGPECPAHTGCAFSETIPADPSQPRGAGPVLWFQPGGAEGSAGPRHPPSAVRAFVFEIRIGGC